MTLDQLTKMDGKELASLSDEELLKFFEDSGYLKVTRPERIIRKKKVDSISTSIQQRPPQEQQALKKLSELGIDLSFMNRKKKK